MCSSGCEGINKVCGRASHSARWIIFGLSSAVAGRRRVQSWTTGHANSRAPHCLVGWRKASPCTSAHRPGVFRSGFSVYGSGRVAAASNDILHVGNGRARGVCAVYPCSDATVFLSSAGPAVHNNSFPRVASEEREHTGAVLRA